MGSGAVASALAFLGASVLLAVRALSPKEYVGLGIEYIERLPTWAVILGSPDAARGQTALGVVQSIR